MEKKAVIYTVGYTGRTIDELKSLVELTGGVIIDTRATPSSRNPDWNKGRLSKMFGDAYVHVAEFGNVNYRIEGAPIQLSNVEGGAERAGKFLRQGRDVILLCACPDHRTCHRAVVASELSSRFGCAVDHVQHRVKPAASASRRRQGVLFE